MPEHISSDLEYSIENIAQSSIQELVELEMNSPISLYGHSMGALVAFEVAWQMRAHRGINVRFVVMAAPSYPGILRLQDPVGDLSDVQNRIELGCHAIDFYDPAGKTLTAPIYTLHGCDDQIVPESASLAWRAHAKGFYRHFSLPAEGHLFHMDSPSTSIECLEQALRDTAP